MTYQKLIKQLVASGKLKTPRIIKAFQKIDRAHFILAEYKDRAGDDIPFSIGFGQTISQPSTVAFMMEALRPQKGDRILDIGFGSGWTSALLAEIVGQKGKIYAVEIIPEIFRFGKKNVENLGYQNVEFFQTDASGGLIEKSPFDRILASASAPKLFKILKNQLKIKGIMVIPIQDTVVKIERFSKNKYKKKTYPFFAFVPMRGKFGQG